MFEQWIQDIGEDKVTLDRIKLCICGHPRVGKSAMRQSLSRPYLQVIELHVRVYQVIPGLVYIHITQV